MIFFTTIGFEGFAISAALRLGDLLSRKDQPLENPFVLVQPASWAV